MSAPYTLEPQTGGKVLLHTTLGELDIEIWPTQTPKTCRNFVQLCMEGYYNDCIFHRVIKDFMAQTGDPTGTGTGGQSIYGEPFKDEIHSRLKFARRGIVAMANSGRNKNESQFFLTLSEQMHLNGKHTIFGKVTGNTIFNLLKVNDIELEDDRPKYPPKIIRTEILNNPFPDIKVREKKKAKKDKKKKKKRRYEKLDENVLSFAVEEDEEEVLESFRKKPKNLQAVLKSNEPAQEKPPLESESVEGDVDIQATSSPTETSSSSDLARIRDKLHKKPNSSSSKSSESSSSESTNKKSSITSEAKDSKEESDDDVIVLDDKAMLGDVNESEKEYDERMKKEAMARYGAKVHDKDKGEQSSKKKKPKRPEDIEDSDKRRIEIRKAQIKLQKELLQGRKAKEKQEQPQDEKLSALAIRNQRFKRRPKRSKKKKKTKGDDAFGMLGEFKSALKSSEETQKNNKNALDEEPSDEDEYDPNWMGKGQLKFALRPQDYNPDDFREAQQYVSYDPRKNKSTHGKMVRGPDPTRRGRDPKRKRRGR